MTNVLIRDRRGETHREEGDDPMKIEAEIGLWQPYSNEQPEPPEARSKRRFSSRAFGGVEVL